MHLLGEMENTCHTRHFLYPTANMFPNVFIFYNNKNW